MLTLTKDMKITRVSSKVAAGVVATDSARVDMTGFDSVAFIASVDTSLTTATLNLTAKSNPADSTVGSTTEKAGTTITDAGGNQANRDFIVDVHRPQNRYAYATFTPLVANVALNAIYAVQYNASKGPLPITQPTTSTVDQAGPNA